MRPHRRTMSRWRKPRQNRRLPFFNTPTNNGWARTQRAPAGTQYPGIRASRRKPLGIGGWKGYQRNAMFALQRPMWQRRVNRTVNLTLRRRGQGNAMIRKIKSFL